MPYPDSFLLSYSNRQQVLVLVYHKPLTGLVSPVLPDEGVGDLTRKVLSVSQLLLSPFLPRTSYLVSIRQAFAIIGYLQPRASARGLS